MQGAVIVEPIDFTKGTAAQAILQKLKQQASDSIQNSSVDFLFVAGDGRDDEVVFEWANDLKEQNIVPKVSTVCLGSRNTQAMYTLRQGVTGMCRAFDL